MLAVDDVAVSRKDLLGADRVVVGIRIEGIFAERIDVFVHGCLGRQVTRVAQPEQISDLQHGDLEPVLAVSVMPLLSVVEDGEVVVKVRQAERATRSRVDRVVNHAQVAGDDGESQLTRGVFDELHPEIITEQLENLLSALSLLGSDQVMGRALVGQHAVNVAEIVIDDRGAVLVVRGSVVLHIVRFVEHAVGQLTMTGLVERAGPLQIVGKCLDRRRDDQAFAQRELTEGADVGCRAERVAHDAHRGRRGGNLPILVADAQPQ